MAKRLLVICTLLCLDLFVFVLIYESNVEDSVKASTTFYENVIALAMLMLNLLTIREMWI